MCHEGQTLDFKSVASAISPHRQLRMRYEENSYCKSEFVLERYFERLRNAKPLGAGTRVTRKSSGNHRHRVSVFNDCQTKTTPSVYSGDSSSGLDINSQHLSTVFWVDISEPQVHPWTAFDFMRAADDAPSSDSP